MKQLTVNKIKNILSLLLLILSTSGLLFIIYKYGFRLSQSERYFFDHILNYLAFSIMFISFLKFIFKSNFKETLFKNKYFFIIFGIFLIIEIVNEFFHSNFKFTSISYLSIYENIVIFFTHFVIAYQFFASMAGYNTKISFFKYNPSFLFLGSFGILILSGTILLSLPNACVPGESISFVDAFFTATSASCVTGLIVVDTATKFTTFGQTIIMILFQVGGFGIITITAFFVTFLGKRFGVKSLFIVGNIINDESLVDLKGTLRKILRITLGIESIGALFLFISWYSKFRDVKKTIYFSVFHSISSFCNAGFSLFSENLFNELGKNSPIVIYTIIFLIICGSLGFKTIIELFDRIFMPKKIKKKLSLQSKIVIPATIILILSAAILFFFLEQDASLANMSLIEKINHSLFQSVTLRTAGLNTVDFTKILPATIFMMLLYMFIGGSSGSTSGGVKITTVAVGVLSLKSIITGERRLNVLKRNIPFRNFNNVVVIIMFSLLLIFFSVFILLLTEKNVDFLKLLFEEVSAFATVGLSMGITSSLSITGKIVIIISMFVGRVGPLTLAVALATREKEVVVEYEYPEEAIMVG